jgi:hypothetical protein
MNAVRRVAAELHWRPERSRRRCSFAEGMESGAGMFVQTDLSETDMFESEVKARKRSYPRYKVT